jgi:AcrR family transcriptional regulator
MSEFVRARRPEQKQQRRDAILSAARQLAIDSGVDNVSLGNVATAVGLAKSNIVRYFGTREEIYLELAADCWQEWRDEVLKRLGEGDEVIDALVGTLDARPLFCDLLSHGTTSLERNVSVDAARDYKRVMSTTLHEVGSAVANAHPVLTEREGFELVTAAIALASVLFPAANPSPTLAEAYAQNPDIASAYPRFVPTMTRYLSAMAAGYPSLRE